MVLVACEPAFGFMRWMAQIPSFLWVWQGELVDQLGASMFAVHQRGSLQTQDSRSIVAHTLGGVDKKGRRGGGERL